jgi:hypothetical protein
MIKTDEFTAEWITNRGNARNRGGCGTGIRRDLAFRFHGTLAYGFEQANAGRDGNVQ